MNKGNTKRHPIITQLRKSVALAMGLFMVCAVLIMSYYVVTESNHDCHEEDCPICQCIHACENILNNVSDGITILFSAILPILFLLSVVSIYHYIIREETLVSLNIQLND